MINIKDLSVSLIGGAGEVNILRGVDLNVSTGETICVVGSSGAGKTTDSAAQRIHNAIRDIESQRVPSQSKINNLAKTNLQLSPNELTADLILLATALLLKLYFPLASEISTPARDIWLGDGAQSAAVLDRASVTTDMANSGPIIFMEPTSSTWVPPGWRASRDAFGLLHLQREVAQ